MENFANKIRGGCDVGQKRKFELVKSPALYEILPRDNSMYDIAHCLALFLPYLYVYTA